MPRLTREDRRYLLRLARSAIARELGEDDLHDRIGQLSDELKTPQGCFVTLEKEGALRGCIGALEPVTPLADGVEENAKNAAFHDPRFSPLKKQELDQIEIEISRLTVPVDLQFSTPEELLEKLKPGVHGVILKRGWHRSTFLPQVWDQLPDKVQFLEHLCRKAGLGGNCWKEKDLSIKVYEVEHFSEKELGA
ncbi:MAG: AmmeMemoRadiSam system protein A [Desulfobacterales bacterium]|nr:AmmeMemoRadiSam system protein A [Desulfobacterales bacterium]